jgi:hypothetical protein
VASAADQTAFPLEFRHGDYDVIRVFCGRWGLAGKVGRWNTAQSNDSSYKFLPLTVW